MDILFNYNETNYASSGVILSKFILRSELTEEEYKELTTLCYYITVTNNKLKEWSSKHGDRTLPTLYKILKDKLGKPVEEVNGPVKIVNVYFQWDSQSAVELL